MSSQWFPVVTLILGSVLALASGILTQSIKARQDRAAANDQMKVQSSKESFEELRKLLADIQDASEKLVEAIYEVAESFDSPDGQQDAMKDKLRVAQLQCTLIFSRLPEPSWQKLSTDLLDAAGKVHAVNCTEDGRKVTDEAWNKCSALLQETGKPFQEYYRQGLDVVQRSATGNGRTGSSG
jgi:type VI protein secretion system component VasK